MTRAQVFTFRLILTAVLIVVTHLATTPLQYPVIKHILDKANHVMAFYVLALLIDFSFPKSQFGAGKLGLLLIYGSLIEVIQSFLPHRTASAVDVLADGLGVACYALSIPILRRIPLLSRRWNGQVDGSTFKGRV
jgi:VanZ family protein